jgi:recombination protein RecR
VVRRRGSIWAASAGWACRACEAVSTSYAPPVQRLVTELSKLPGIGSRTAQRLAFHILRASGEDASALAAAILEVKEKIGLCEVCFNLTDETRCRICEDSRRDHGLICVVEEPSDVIPMERTHEYHGVYHVLGGALSPIDGVDPEDLKIAELFARVAAGGRASDGRADEQARVAAGVPVREVVLATNPTTTGEATALHVAEELRVRAPEVEVTRLASGLPVGSDLEYADEVTLGKAFAGRRAV